MRKYLIIPGFLLLLVWGCSSTRDVGEMGPDERLQYALNLYNDEDYEEAATEFEALLLQFPGSSIIDDAQYYLGMCKYNRDEFILGAYEFSKLIKNMPASEFVANAQFMLAESYYELSPNYTLDQKYTVKAIEEYQAFIDFFPLNEKVAEAEQKITELNDKLARKEYSIAYIYQRMQYYTASLKYYDAVVEIFHDTPYAPMALYSKIMLLMDREREDEALSDMKKFVRMYPDDQNFQEINDLKNSLEAKLKGGYSSSE
ncbi:MAG TPA: outer membrane protein assembly factor BamD [Ignavibacteriaceae bacterium]